MIQASEKCFELVKHFEGCKLVAYPDSAGLYTIGIGTTVYPDGKPVKKGQTCTEDQARQWFLWDLKEAEGKLMRWLTVEDKLPQHKIDALISIVYNLGYPQSLIRAVNNNHNDPNIAGLFQMYVKAGGRTIAGLVRRRRAESWLYFHNELKYFEPLK